MPRRRLVEDADDFVLDEAQPLGAAPAVAIPQQLGLRGLARGDEFRLQQLRHRGAEQVAVAVMTGGEGVDVGRDPRGIETFVGFGLGGGGSVHD